MKELSLDQFESKASEFSKKGEKWHFHILTPDCALNNSKKYTLVLENSSTEEVFVNYSDEPHMGIGEKLVKILHGDDVVVEGDETIEEPSSQVTKILERADKLHMDGKFWHHHMLFPDCIYNKNQGKWMIIFEDQDNGEVIESVSEEEPKSDLKHIEKLFYSQKK